VGLPLSLALAFGLPLAGVFYFYGSTFPPAAINARLFNGYPAEPCCWPLLHCSGDDGTAGDNALDPASYAATFYCPDGISIMSEASNAQLFTCDEFKASAEAKGY
jgi:hypothetical protein